MSGAVPQKIVLKSTTKISLNDRFSSIKPKPAAPTTQQVRATMAAQQQASAKNRRLAQQMANRPSVVAALKIKKRSMKQRLGVNIKSRLSLPQQSGQIRGRGRGRGQRGGQQFQRGTGQAVFRQRGGSPKRVLRGRGGVRARGAVRGRGGTVRGSVARGRGVRGGSTTYIRGRGGQSFRGQRGAQRGTQRGNFRGRRGQRGGRGGRGGRGRGQQNPVSREDLDSQLDAYMAKTKGHLDAELDAYMAQSNMGDE